VVHAYSQDRGGKVFTAQAIDGSDADCARARMLAASALGAERVEVVTLSAGQIACVEAQSRRGYELLWHARPASPEELAVAVAHNRR
jgi:hypothetical protein